MKRFFFSKRGFLFLFFFLFVVVLTAKIAFPYFFFQEVPVSQVFPGQAWAHILPQLKPVKGVGGVSAKDCGNCHTEIYAEWSTSTHSQAFHDLQFQAELAKPSSPQWICLNCHLPVQNQRDSLVLGLKNGDPFRPILKTNLDFDPGLRDEGVTCATCHLRQDEDGSTYVLGANGATNPPHPVKINPSLLRNRCADCHNSTYTLNEGLVCYFQTADEMQKAKTLHPNKDCASCHLPEVQRSFVKPELKKPIRKSHKHGFVGSGVPKKFDFFAYQLPNGYIPGIQVSNLAINSQNLQIELYNQYAGHHVTSGDPERFVRIEVEWLDESGQVLKKETERIGQEWEWSPKAKQISDNRLVSGEKRRLSWNVPKEISVAKAAVRLVHVKLKNQVSDYMSMVSEGVPLPYRNQVKKIQDLYPHSAIFYESTIDTKSKVQSRTSLEELMERNAKRRGE